MSLDNVSATQFTQDERDDLRKERGSTYQLPMFETARNLIKMNEPTNGDVRLGERTVEGVHEDYWDRVQKEAEAADLTKSIRERGVEAPVHVGHGTVYKPLIGNVDRTMGLDGGHRIGASHAIHPDTLVPVEHTDMSKGNFKGGSKSPPLTDEQGKSLPRGRSKGKP